MEKERTDSCKLSSDLCARTVPCVPTISEIKMKLFLVSVMLCPHDTDKAETEGQSLIISMWYPLFQGSYHHEPLGHIWLMVTRISVCDGGEDDRGDKADCDDEDMKTHVSCLI